MKHYFRWWRMAIVVGLVAACLSGCGEPLAVVSEEPIDTRYAAAYTSVETDYKHKYNWWKNEFVLVPEVHSVNHPEKWEILYRVTYDNGAYRDEWRQCSKSEYEAAAEVCHE